MQEPFEGWVYESRTPFECVLISLAVNKVVNSQTRFVLLQSKRKVPPQFSIYLNHFTRSASLFGNFCTAKISFEERLPERLRLN